MARGLNGETVFKAEDVPVGYVAGAPYGYKRKLRVTVDVRMEALDRQDSYETTSHDHVSRPLDFAITTSVWRPDLRDSVAGGATVEPLREVIESGDYADGWDAGQVQTLLRLAPWHLNSMSAACDHQHVIYAPDQYGREVPSLDLTEPCPLTGYKYSHAWLVRPLPDGFEQQIRGLFA